MQHSTSRSVALTSSSLGSYAASAAASPLPATGVDAGAVVDGGGGGGGGDDCGAAAVVVLAKA